MRITKYTAATKEKALINMYQKGVTATDKSKIIRARKLPRNAMDNFDFFRTYFLSDEGLPRLMKQLSQEEVIVLHVLAFNQWITDVSVFEAAYIQLPKPMKYYYIGRETFTQRYGSVLKAVQANLVQKGLLIKYEDALGGNSKTERQRFLFPTEFAAHLHSPFSDLRGLPTTGKTTYENIRKEIKQAIQSSPKPTLSGLALIHKKLYLKKDLLNSDGLAEIQLRQWRLDNSALILSSQYFDEGKPLTAFIFHHLKQLDTNQWLSEKSVATLLSVWDDPKKRNELDIDKKYPSRYNAKRFFEAGWKAGLMEKQTKAGTPYYRLAAESSDATDFGKHLKIKEDGTLLINLTTVPLSALVILNQLATFQTNLPAGNVLKPDLVNISSLSADLWKYPLIDWLKENAPTFKVAFAQYKKKYGKEIIHNNLLVAKVTDLSVRVLVEKGLQKEGQLVVLSDEFIAFPKSALSLVERIITKSGNVIKRVAAR